MNLFTFSYLAFVALKINKNNVQSTSITSATAWYFTVYLHFVYIIRRKEGDKLIPFNFLNNINMLNFMGKLYCLDSPNHYLLFKLSLVYTCTCIFSFLLVAWLYVHVHVARTWNGYSSFEISGDFKTSFSQCFFPFARELHHYTVIMLYQSDNTNLAWLALCQQSEPLLSVILEYVAISERIQGIFTQIHVFHCMHIVNVQCAWKFTVIYFITSFEQSIMILL